MLKKLFPSEFYVKPQWMADNLVDETWLKGVKRDIFLGRPVLWVPVVKFDKPGSGR